MDRPPDPAHSPTLTKLSEKQLRSYGYKQNFKALAEHDPDMKRFTTVQFGCDFQNPQFVLQLAKTILKVDFGLKLEMPLDRLVPMIANRYLYVAWVKDLLNSTEASYQAGSTDRAVNGLDIGTGASCIYPMLMLATTPESWRMAATDIDPDSISYARNNIAMNGFENRCSIIQTDRTGPLIPMGLLKEKLGAAQHLDFVMCNPPFFDSVQAWEDSIAGIWKAENPAANCTGAKDEMVTEGGDTAFVLQMVEESLLLGKEVTWYTAQFGVKDSLYNVVRRLRFRRCMNYAIHTLQIPESRTRRWFLGWSWGDMRPSELFQYAARSAPGVDPDFLPQRAVFYMSFDPHKSMKVISRLLEWLESLDLLWAWDPVKLTGIGKSKENVWSRPYRRRQKQQQAERASRLRKHEAESDHVSPPEKLERIQINTEDVALGFKIEAWPREGTICVLWMQGSDHQLYQNFCNSACSDVRKVEKITSSMDEPKLSDKSATRAYKQRPSQVGVGSAATSGGEEEMEGVIAATSGQEDETDVDSAATARPKDKMDEA